MRKEESDDEGGSDGNTADTAKTTNISVTQSLKTSDSNAPYLYLLLIIPASVAIAAVGMRRRAAGR